MVTNAMNVATAATVDGSVPIASGASAAGAARLNRRSNNFSPWLNSAVYNGGHFERLNGNPEEQAAEPLEFLFTAASLRVVKGAGWRR